MESQTPRPLFTEEAIRRRVDELAAEISRDYEGKGEILLVGVLKGAFMFLADLSRRLTIPRRVDFIAVASYGNSTVPSDSCSAPVRPEWPPTAPSERTSRRRAGWFGRTSRPSSLNGPQPAVVQKQVLQGRLQASPTSVVFS